MASSEILRRDGVLIALTATTVLVLSLAFDLGETFFGWVRGLKAWQVDELVLTLFVTALALVWFSYRRVGELKALARERAEIEETLRHCAAIVASSEDAIIGTTSDGRIKSWNPGAERLLGYRADEALGQPVRMLMPAPKGSDSQQLVSSIQDGERLLHRELMLEDKSGAPVAVWLTIAPIYDADGSFAGTGFIAHNISQHKEMEQKILQAQKLESLGALAGGIAHDFNNLLFVILGQIELVRITLPENAPESAKLDQIEKAAQRAAHLSAQMLAYSGQGHFVIEPLDLKRLLEGMLSLIHSAFPSEIEFEHEFADQPLLFSGDRNQLPQLIMSLVTNAVEAIGADSGKVILRTGALNNVDQAYLSQTYLDEALEEGRYVFFEVIDTGCGMDVDTQRQLFDPFFTKKFTGRGLGLAAALGIVRGHGGAIKVSSESGVGTGIRVLLPATEEPKILVPDGAQDSEAWVAAGAVLVVDDEEAVLDIARQMLEHHGFKVRLAHDGCEAVEVFREHHDEITVVLLDMTMPKMDGAATFRELRRIQQDATVILSSGYGEQDATESFGDQRPAGFLQKPYSQVELLEKLREVLHNENGAAKPQRQRSQCGSKTPRGSATWQTS